MRLDHVTSISTSSSMAFQPFQPAAPLWSNGPSPGAFYNLPGTSSALELPAKHTM